MAQIKGEVTLSLKETEVIGVRTDFISAGKSAGAVVNAMFSAPVIGLLGPQRNY